MGMIEAGTKVRFTKDIPSDVDPYCVLAEAGSLAVVKVAGDAGRFAYHVETDSGLTLRVFEGEIEVVS